MIAANANEFLKQQLFVVEITESFIFLGIIKSKKYRKIIHSILLYFLKQGPAMYYLH